MKFVIYGAGYRGKQLQHYLGSDKVAAYIDSDTDKINTIFCGKRVISLEEYIKDYRDVFIIITPGYAYANEIEDVLISKGIYCFSKIDELPSEFRGYGKHGFIEYCSSFVLKPGFLYYIYGFNAFSLMIYELLKEKNPNVYIVLDRTFDIQKKKHIIRQYKEMVIECSELDMRDNIMVLLTVEEDEDYICQRFPYAEVLDVIDYSSNLPEYYNETIRPLKHVYMERKRCFIVATGPSLRGEDLYILNKNKEFCISMNKIYMYKGDWIPDVYVCTDSVLIGESMDEIEKYTSKLKFVGDSYQGFWERQHNNTYRIHVVANVFNNLLPKFSENICQKVYGGSTVTYACIQIAVYLGFTEIYLLGVDCNYLKNSQNNHFYDSNVVDNRNHYEDRMILAYQAAKKYADEHGIKIYNATRGGALEVFERVDFDSLFEGGQ